MNKQQVPGSPAAAVSDSDLSQIQPTKQALEQLLLSPGWYTGYRQEISEQSASISKVETQAIGFQSSLSSALSSSLSAMGLSESLNVLQSSYKVYAQHYIQPGLAIQAREQERLNRQSSDAERKEKERAAQSKWNEAQSLLQSMKTVPQKEEHQKQFDEVKQRYEANLHFNQLLQEGQPLNRIRIWLRIIEMRMRRLKHRCLLWVRYSPGWRTCWRASGIPYI